MVIEFWREKKEGERHHGWGTFDNFWAHSKFQPTHVCLWSIKKNKNLFLKPTFLTLPSIMKRKYLVVCRRSNKKFGWLYESTTVGYKCKNFNVLLDYTSRVEINVFWGKHSSAASLHRNFFSDFCPLCVYNFFIFRCKLIVSRTRVWRSSCYILVQKKISS